MDNFELDFWKLWKIPSNLLFDRYRTGFSSYLLAVWCKRSRLPDFSGFFHSVVVILAPLPIECRRCHADHVASANAADFYHHEFYRRVWTRIAGHPVTHQFCDCSVVLLIRATWKTNKLNKLLNIVSNQLLIAIRTLWWLTVFTDDPISSWFVSSNMSSMVNDWSSPSWCRILMCLTILARTPKRYCELPAIVL